ncbi:MAG TPA: universal stress protein [Hyphomicrobiales bacterium]|nr:universal stress protein [Hyphomicrobiales bacterium]
MTDHDGVPAIGPGNPSLTTRALVRERLERRQRNYQFDPVVVFALLAEPDVAPRCLDAAFGAAQAVDGRIVALHVGYHPAHVWTSAEETALQGLRERREGTPDQRLALIRAAFDEWRHADPVRADAAWRDGEGDVESCVDREAEKADLLVVVHPGNLDASDALHAAIFQSRRLVLVAPRRAEPPRRGPLTRHVMIGWKPGDHARRAIAAAAPWLKAAGELTVVCVNEPADRPYRPSIATLLADLGLPPRIECVTASNESVGACLLRQADLLDASCLVTGAFKHGPLLELVLGGVTHDLLARAEIPLLMMH